MRKALIVATCLLALALAGSPRLPRTSADQRNTRNVNTAGGNLTGSTLAPPTRNNSQRNREQYLFNVFEVIVSTLESKLQRIENLDKAVEHLMRRVEALDSRVNDNIDKTDAVITKLRTLDLKLFNAQSLPAAGGTIYLANVNENKSENGEVENENENANANENESDGAIGNVPRIRVIHYDREDGSSSRTGAAAAVTTTRMSEALGEKLLSLDQKVSDIDNKLVGLKNQLDNNLLQNDDINAEASEKKPVSMSVIEITKAMSNEVMNHVSIEIENLRQATGSMDRKLQFHMNLMSDNLAAVYNMMSEVHEAIVDKGGGAVNVNVNGNGNGNGNGNANGHGNVRQIVNFTATTERPPKSRRSKIDRLVEQMYPVLTVSEKMDEVWNVVVGTKSSVDDLLPKSDELLTQTQRQERAISEIHADLRSKTNKIIENLEGVENRLRKQEDDVATLAQRPIPAEYLLDPTIDRLVEYDPSRYVGLSDDFTTESPVTTQATLSSISVSLSSSSSSSSLSGSGSGSTPSLSSPSTISTMSTSTSTSVSTSSSSSSSSATAASSSNPPSGATTTTTISSVSTPSNNASTAAAASNSTRSMSKNRGVIFPSVKNKPNPANSSFVSDVLVNYKDIKGFSCVDLLNGGMKDSGVYYLQIRGTTYWFLKVYCEQEIAEGGWTVIQRRDDFGEPRENFNRDWADYKNGFGDPAKEFWLGNENIYMLTNNEDYALRVELEDFEGNKRYAQYSHFKIYSEGEYYKLEIDGYEGTAGDSLNDPWYGSNNSPFSTYNRDNDRSSLNCASMLKGGWWWKSCGRGLNGLYLNDPQDLTARQGIVWFRWRGWDYTLKRATMMIRAKAGGGGGSGGGN